MSGHSKWATIKRQKAAVDAKRGAVFTKLGNLISIAAREKGGNLETNFSLRIAVEKAKAANMPRENIERAVKRGTGELGGEQIEELIYEGFGPAQSQFIIKCLTANKNRTAAEVRHLFSKHHGSLGSVSWNFSKKGLLRINNDELRIKNLQLDNFELELIDIGVDDIKKEEEGIVIYTKMEDLQKVKNFLDSKNIQTESAEVEYVSKDEISVSKEERAKIEEFIKDLEEHEDISDYYHNIQNI